MIVFFGFVFMWTDVLSNVSGLYLWLESTFGWFAVPEHLMNQAIITESTCVFPAVTIKPGHCKISSSQISLAAD